MSSYHTVSTTKTALQWILVGSRAGRECAVSFLEAFFDEVMTGYVCDINRDGLTL
jgi:hypothetical protein